MNKNKGNTKKTPDMTTEEESEVMGADRSQIKGPYNIDRLKVKYITYMYI